MDETRKQFAVEMLRHDGDAFEASKAVFPHHMSAAIMASEHWPHDPEIIAYMDELRHSTDAEEYLPTKAETARLIYNIGSAMYIEPKDRIAALKLYADLRGFTAPKNAPANNVTNFNTVNKVMVVTDHGNIDAWEMKLKKQQAALIDVSRSTTADA
jgi:hypothetical protein